MNFGTKIGGWIAIAGAAALAFTAAATTQGCTVTTGEPDDGGFSGTDSNTPPKVDAGGDATPVSDPCNACAFSLCAPYNAVCFGESSCMSVYQCAIQPGANVDNCVNAGKAQAQLDYQQLATCDLYAMCTSCAAQCANTPHDCGLLDAGTPEPDAAPPADSGPATDAAPPVDSGPTSDASAPASCDQCTSASCASQKAACATGTDCAAYNACLEACQNAQCLADCDNAHPTGKTAFAALGVCTTTSCQSACGLSLH